MATKAIKFKDSNHVYLPVTNSKLVQYGSISVKQAIDDLVTVEQALLNDIQNTAGELVVSDSASSTSNTATVGSNPYVNLISYDGDTVLSSLALEGNGLTVSYANNKLTFTTAAANNGKLIVSDGENSLTIFSADESTNKTFNVIGGTQITSAVSTVESVPTVTISHEAITTTVVNRPTIADQLDEHHFDLSYVKEIAIADNGHVSSYELGIIRFGEGAKAVHGTVAADNTGYVTGDDVNTAINGVLTNLASALKYQGMINSVSDVPQNPQLGDTYFIGSAMTIGGNVCEQGDMAVYDGESWDIVNANWTAQDGTSTLVVGASTATTLATIGGVAVDAQISGLSITDKNPTTPVAGTITNSKFTAITAVEAKEGGFTYVNTEYTLPADINTAATWATAVSGNNNAAQINVGINDTVSNATNVKVVGSGSAKISVNADTDTITVFAPVVTPSEDLQYDTFTLDNLEEFTLSLTADETNKPIVTAVAVSANS